MKTGIFFDRTFFKFITVGVINTLVGSAIMFALFNIFFVSYWLSSACNYIFTSILSFFMNKYFTFSVRNWSGFMIVAYIANIAICYFVAYGIARPFVNILLAKTSQTIRENVALFVGMCMFTGLNYIGQRLFVFRKEKKNDS